MTRKILVTGGAGYIGSQVVRELLRNSFQPVVIDNLSTGFRNAIPENVLFYETDVRDSQALQDIFLEHNFLAVIHLAAKMVVEESIQDPLGYYDNNVNGTISLLYACKKFNVTKLVFSSTSTIYGNSNLSGRLTEDSPVEPLSPYGSSKYICEKIIQECQKNFNLRTMILRYFNVAGAASDGSNGQRRKSSTHLVHIASEVATGRKNTLTIYGDDYPTADGTCVRDYIYIEDIAHIHYLALEHLLKHNESHTINCGYGEGYSVQQLVSVYEKANQIQIPMIKGPRRAGDPDSLICDTSRLKKILGFQPREDHLSLICKTAYQWQIKLNQEYLSAKF